jgi:hypothetical protein
MRMPSRTKMISYGTAIMGLGALAYSIWPPELEPQYLTLGGSLLGVPALGKVPTQ